MFINSIPFDVTPFSLSSSFLLSVDYTNQNRPPCSPQVFDERCVRVLGYRLPLPPLRLPRTPPRRHPLLNKEPERCTARLSVCLHLDHLLRIGPLFFVSLLGKSNEKNWANSPCVFFAVIGSGPAAHTAAIYLARAELKRKSLYYKPPRENEK